MSEVSDVKMLSSWLSLLIALFVCSLDGSVGSFLCVFSHSLLSSMSRLVLYCSVSSLSWRIAQYLLTYFLTMSSKTPLWLLSGSALLASFAEVAPFVSASTVYPFSVVLIFTFLVGPSVPVVFLLLLRSVIF